MNSHVDGEQRQSKCKILSGILYLEITRSVHPMKGDCRAHPAVLCTFLPQPLREEGRRAPGLRAEGQVNRGAGGAAPAPGRPSPIPGAASTRRWPGLGRRGAAADHLQPRGRPSRRPRSAPARPAPPAPRTRWPRSRPSSRRCGRAGCGSRVPLRAAPRREAPPAAAASAVQQGRPRSAPAPGPSTRLRAGAAAAAAGAAAGPAGRSHGRWGRGRGRDPVPEDCKRAPRVPGGGAARPQRGLGRVAAGGGVRGRGGEAAPGVQVSGLGEGGGLRVRARVDSGARSAAGGGARARRGTGHRALGLPRGGSRRPVRAAGVRAAVDAGPGSRAVGWPRVLTRRDPAAWRSARRGRREGVQDVARGRHQARGCKGSGSPPWSPPRALRRGAGTACGRWRGGGTAAVRFPQGCCVMPSTAECVSVPVSVRVCARAAGQVGSARGPVSSRSPAPPRAAFGRRGHSLPRPGTQRLPARREHPSSRSRQPFPPLRPRPRPEPSAPPSTAAPDATSFFSRGKDVSSQAQSPPLSQKVIEIFKF